jgi:hypothetical protein
MANDELKRLGAIFHFIGYGMPEHVENHLASLGNCKYYGKVEPSLLHEHVRKWDIALIPFKSNKLSLAVDPIKIYEYLFFGLPVISKGIKHLGDLPYVFDVESVEESADVFKRFVKGEYLFNYNEIESFLISNQWDNRFEALLEECGKKRLWKF